MPQSAEVQQGSTTAAAKKVRVFITRSDTAAPYIGITETIAAANFKYSREAASGFTAIDFTVTGIDLTEVGEGFYDLVAPDLAFATAAGVGFVMIAWSGVSNMLGDSVQVFLRAYDPKAAPATTGDFITALRAEHVGSAWGVTSQPVGGSTITYSERRAIGGTLGTRTAYYDSTGKLVGLTAVV